MSATLTPEERERRILAKMAEIRQRKVDQEIEQEAKRRLKREAMKSRAWVRFVIIHAKQIGWEPFSATVTIWHPTTGEGVEIQEYYPGSELESAPDYTPQGDRVYKTIHVMPYSMREKCQYGDSLSYAMQFDRNLAAHYWNPKTQTGTKPELYKQFEAQYNLV